MVVVLAAVKTGDTVQLFVAPITDGAPDRAVDAIAMPAKVTRGAEGGERLGGGGGAGRGLQAHRPVGASDVAAGDAHPFISLDVILEQRLVARAAGGAFARIVAAIIVERGARGDHLLGSAIARLVRGLDRRRGEQRGGHQREAEGGGRLAEHDHSPAGR